VEMGVRFADLGVEAGTQIRFFIMLERGGLEIERCPSRGPVSIDVPTEEFELVNWYA